MIRNFLEASKVIGLNKVRTFLMMLGIMISIATLIVVVSIGQGAKKQVMQKVANMGATDSLMVFSGVDSGPRGMETGVTSLELADAKAIETQLQDVKEVVLVQNNQAEIKNGSASEESTIWGVSDNYSRVRKWDVEGEFFNQEAISNAERTAVIGKTVAKTLFDDADPIGKNIKINNISFQIIGVMAPRGTSPGGKDLDDTVMIPYTTFGSKLFNVTQFAQLVVQVKDVTKIKMVKTGIEEILRERHNITSSADDDFNVRIPNEAAQLNSGISKTITIFLILISLISLIVGGIMIMNIMLITVSERTKEIGLRKAIGATYADILTQFLTESAIVAFMGGLLGVPLGAAGAFLLSMFLKWPTSVSWWSVVIAVIFSVIVGIFFGMQPAKKAACLNPIEALRSE